MRALVTGGGGFLGGAIVHRLHDRGDVVRSISRNRYPALDERGVEQVQGDIADAGAVNRAVAGCDIVFHVAAKAGVWGPAEEYRRANIVGTGNVIAACRKNGVRRLVFTSSPSVVTTGHDIEGGNESLPYPSRYLADYPRTKAAAERLVLAANRPDLATVSLRPHLIWGPGDHHLVPRLIARARAGRLWQVGRGTNRADVTYIDNAAAAHLLAADSLATRSPIAGKVYFISDGEPVQVWPFVNRILSIAGLPPARQSVSRGVAYATGTAAEFAYRLLGRRDEPPMTRFLAVQLASSHWFNISAARRDLGYAPVVSIKEGLERLGHWLASGAG
jgi:nucleoside-diphosphate-sugar epimerase